MQGAGIYMKNQKYGVCSSGPGIFGSDRRPRRGDLVCACVCVSVTFLKRTLKRSSRELKKGLRRK